MKCDKCQNKAWCYDGNHELTRHGCAENNWCCFSPITNADRIRSMSDEELANQLAGEQYVGIRTFLLGFDKELLEDLDEEIKKAWSEVVKEKLDWLKQEAASDG